MIVHRFLLFRNREVEIDLLFSKLSLFIMKVLENINKINIISCGHLVTEDGD